MVKDGCGNKKKKYKVVHKYTLLILQILIEYLPYTKQK